MVFGCHGLDFAMLYLVVDNGAGCRRIHGVQQSHGDTGEFGRLDAGGVQDFCAEIGKFRRFFEVELAYGFRVVYHARVVVVHAVDVGPDLDFLAHQCRADKAGGVVRAAAQQVIYFSVCVAADEALRDVDVIVRMGFELFADFFFNVVQVGFRVFVGTHEIQRRQEDDLHAAFLQVVGHHVRADDFSLCQDNLFFERSEEDFGETTQVVEFFFQEVQRFLLVFFCGVEFFHVLLVFPFQLFDDVVRAFRVLFVQVVRDFHQCIGCSRHGRKHDHVGKAVFRNQAAYVFHPLCGPYGGAAEFHYFHISRFLIVFVFFDAF